MPNTTEDTVPVATTEATVENPTVPLAVNTSAQPVIAPSAPLEVTTTAPTVTATEPTRDLNEVTDDIHKWIRDVERVVKQAVSVPTLKADFMSTIHFLEKELEAAGGAIIAGLKEAKEKLL